MGQDNKTKDYALVMKSITMSDLERHKSNAAESQMECHLDYAANEGVIPQADMMWRCLWGYAENEIINNIEEKYQDFKAKNKGRETRT